MIILHFFHIFNKNYDSESGHHLSFFMLLYESHHVLNSIG
ncbi:hypothetical protein L477_03447 [Klebsiella pneumoniae BIDMC 40]|nr:hypothetical protein L477_03447 [Klebsiella pneumoniae BIDMC 40]